MHEVERGPEHEAASGAQRNEKFVCDRCFDDYAIKDFIKAHTTARQCSFCGRRNVRKDIAASGRQVLAFILTGLRSDCDYVDDHALPYDDEEGEYTVPVYDMWELMHDQLSEISSNEPVLDWIVESLDEDDFRRRPYSRTRCAIALKPNLRFSDRSRKLCELDRIRSMPS